MNKSLQQNKETEKTSKALMALAPLAFILFLSVIAYIIYVYETKSRSEYLLKMKGFSTALRQQFDGTAGEHQQLKKIAKNSLEFPQSYKHIETIYVKNDISQEILVRTLFSGQDTYKSEIVHCLKAQYSYSGEVIKPPVPCD